MRCFISDIISAHLVKKMAGLDGRDLELDSLLVDLEHRVTRWVVRGHLVMTYRKVSLNDGSFQ